MWWTTLRHHHAWHQHDTQHQPMPHRLLLNLWREACRHIELHESIVPMSTLVRQRLPADLVVLRRLCTEQHFVETVALGRPGDVPAPAQHRTPVPAGDVARLAAWWREGEVRCGTPSQRDGLLRLVVPADVRGNVLAGPLRTESEEPGFLVVVGAGGAFSGEDEALFRELLEPFGVAYENHRRVRELVRLRERVEADNRALLSRLKRQEVVDDVVGIDGALRPVMTRVEQVAPTDAPVLILGETGTGKEVIARTIHARSSRRAGPIVRVNCGAIPPELVDSELFGHEKGSFTSAVSQRKGWFERADGGTLFLDEIGELPLAAQVRLLRILQDGTFERVGGQQTLTADVRLLAATHRDMETLVREGRFREDLWYRISVFPITLPPLRERLHDIPALANHFARNAGLRFAGYPLEVSEADLRLLASYHWPGNVRELGAVIERAIILGGGGRLDVAGAMGRRLDTRPAPPPRPGAAAPARTQTLDEAVTRHIEQVLHQTDGRIEGPGGAAEVLDVHPNTLRARMQKLGIDWRAFRNNGR